MIKVKTAITEKGIEYAICDSPAHFYDEIGEAEAGDGKKYTLRVLGKVNILGVCNGN